MGQRAFTRRQRLEVAEILVGAALGHLRGPERAAGALHAALEITNRGLDLLRKSHEGNGPEAVAAQSSLLVAMDDGEQSMIAEAIRAWELACWPVPVVSGAAGRARDSRLERETVAV